MNRLFKPSLRHAIFLLLATLLAACLPARAADEPPAEPLPVTVFQNLDAGKKQTVIVYGTSLTAAAAWPKGLQAYFDKAYPGLVTFLNTAQSGQESNWGAANLPERVLSKNPDLVFLEFSVNDAATKHHISLEKSEANLDAMVKALRAQNPNVDIVLQTMNPAWDSPAEPSHKKYASDRPHLADYYEVYRKYAQANALPLVDHYPVWLKLQQQDPAKFQAWLPEGLHPIPEASLAVTLPAIEALLDQARAADQPLHTPSNSPHQSEPASSP